MDFITSSKGLNLRNSMIIPRRVGILIDPFDCVLSFPRGADPFWSRGCSVVSLLLPVLTHDGFGFGMRSDCPIMLLPSWSTRSAGGQN